MSHRASKIQFRPPPLPLPTAYTCHASILQFIGLLCSLIFFYFIMTTLITSTKVPPNWSTQKELSHLGFLSTPASKDWLKRMLWFTISLSVPHICISHTIYSTVYRKSGSVSSRKERKFRQEHYICIKRRSVIPNRASCLLATRLEQFQR